MWLRWNPSPRPEFQSGPPAVTWTAIASSWPIPAAKSSASGETRARSNMRPGVGRARRVQSGRRPEPVQAADRRPRPRRPAALRARLHRRPLPQLRRPRAADHHDFAGAGRMPGRRLRGGAVLRRHRRRAPVPASASPRSCSTCSRAWAPIRSWTARSGKRATEELITSGKLYSADDMLAMGVVDLVVDQGRGEAEVASFIKSPHPQPQRHGRHRRRAPPRAQARLRGTAGRGGGLGGRGAEPQPARSEAHAAPGFPPERPDDAAGAAPADEARRRCARRSCTECAGDVGLRRPDQPANTRARRRSHGAGTARIHHSGSLGQARHSDAETAALGRAGRAGRAPHRRAAIAAMRARSSTAWPARAAGRRAATSRPKPETTKTSWPPRAAPSRKSAASSSCCWKARTRYRDLVETSHDLIWTTDAQGRFTYLNNGCVRHLRPAAEGPDRPLLLRFRGRPAHISNRRFLSTLRRNGEVKNYLTHLISADGNDRWVGINARVSHDDERRDRRHPRHRARHHRAASRRARSSTLRCTIR